MCYTISINKTREFLEKSFGKKFKDGDEFKGEQVIKAFTFPKIPVICQDNTEIIDLLTWGLIPYWVRDEITALEIRKKTFNARIESVNDKPSYKHLIKNRKCLVIVDGFYEWQDLKGKKIPYFIKLKNKEVFTLAGLYDIWVNPSNGEKMKTFTIITTRANPLLENIHNTKKRMPVIIYENEKQDLWLKEEINDKLLELFTEPIDDEIIDAIQLDKKI